MVFLRTKYKAVIIALFLLPQTGLSYAQDSSTEKSSSKTQSAEDFFQLETIVVSGNSGDDDQQNIENRTLRSHKVVDMAEILSDELVEVQMIRKGGYGNEISIRGFGQANMKVLTDGGVLEGACGGRKDPALSHISLLTVDRMILRQGPFDVSKSGYLGGYVDVISKKPTTDFSGEILAKTGSYGFLSSGFTTSGGNDKVQALFGYNYSESDQYKDGNGDELWEVRGVTGSSSYNENGRSMKAFEKNDVWGKVQFTPNDNSRILLEHTYGQAEDIMTPRSGMDIEEETSNLTKASWEITDLGFLSKQLTLSFYRNDVEHLPYNKYRISGAASPKNNIAESVIYGGALANKTVTGFAIFQYGIDLYQQDWNVDIYNSATGAKLNDNLIPSVESKNLGSYIQMDKEVGKWLISSGFRYDNFQQEADEDLVYSSSITDENSQTDYLFSGYLSARYSVSNSTEIWGGLGRNYRTPTSAERYIQSSSGYFGNPELDPTANTEFDLGFTYRPGSWWLQTKAFYSDLDDYIYQENNNSGYKSYTNIDATLWGGDIKAGIELPFDLSLEAGVAYQRGRKDSYPDNNSDKDLGQIAPLKGQLALKYNDAMTSQKQWGGLFGSVEWVYSAKAKDVDVDAGEQELSSWDIVNLRIGYQFKAVTLNIGCDNVFDKQYSVVNSYEWDVMEGSAANPTIVNEPGRFAYITVAYKW